VVELSGAPSCGMEWYPPASRSRFISTEELLGTGIRRGAGWTTGERLRFLSLSSRRNPRHADPTLCDGLKMPKLSILIPCERAIFGNDGSVSLIGIINQFAFPPLPPHFAQNPFPGGVAAPIKWGVFAEFHREPGDNQNRFLFQVDLRAPTEAQVIPGHPQLFLMKEAVHRIYVMFQFFPLVPAGTYNIVARIKGDQEKDWKEVGRYPMTVSYTTPGNPITKTG
jgi:hypothetical protein